MAPVHQFSLGAISPFLALLAFVGAVVGLTAVAESRAASTRGRWLRWLVVAAFAIGGTTIWTMHFVAMSGFAIDGVPVLYDLRNTASSFGAAVVFVFVGLLLAGAGRPARGRVLLAAVCTGAAEAAMHFFGMNAMRLPGMAMFDPRFIAVSVSGCTLAAGLAYWMAFTRDRQRQVVFAAVLLSVAIITMHYTVMLSMQVHLYPVTTPVAGVTAVSLMPVVLIHVATVSGLLMYSLAHASTRSDSAESADLSGWYRRHLSGLRQLSAPPGPAGPSSRSAPPQLPAPSTWSAPPTGPVLEAAPVQPPLRAGTQAGRHRPA